MWELKTNEALVLPTTQMNTETLCKVKEAKQEHILHDRWQKMSRQGNLWRQKADQWCRETKGRVGGG